MTRKARKRLGITMVVAPAVAFVMYIAITHPAFTAFFTAATISGIVGFYLLFWD